MKEVLKRWHSDISTLYSGVRENPEFAFNDDFFNDILEKKSELEELGISYSEPVKYSAANLDISITLDEVSAAINQSKNKKSYLDIPNEVNLCFQTGFNPTEWDNSDIKPIPKKDKDVRDPLQNRCISIMCSVAKIYSSIMNKRLQTYLEKNDLLAEEQNGFRVSRSCIDHVLVLSTVLRNRKALGLDTFVTFVDFQKAFDSVNRDLLFYKLLKIGIRGNFYRSLCVMYKNPRARVVLPTQSQN